MLTFDQLYHPPDVEEAATTWGASCGPAALAAVLRQPLGAIRPLVEATGYGARRSLHPTHLMQVLQAAGRVDARGSHARSGLPPGGVPYGLLFLQWTGPWCQPGVPVRVAYRYTHTVGVAYVEDGLYYYDINACSAVSEVGAWVPFAWWAEEVAPALTQTIPRADGGYFVRWDCHVPVPQTVG